MKLYDRTDDASSLNEIERILIRQAMSVGCYNQEPYDSIGSREGSSGHAFTIDWNTGSIAGFEC
jgi:hypothetical protein